MKLLLVFLTFLRFNIYAQSEVNELITDRPDITESAVTFPFNSIQIETGFQLDNYSNKLLNQTDYHIPSI